MSKANSASWGCAVLALMCSGCAPVTQRVQIDHSAIDAEVKIEREMALQSLLADQKRLYRVSYPLLRAAREFCKDSTTRNALGVLAVNRYMLGQFAEVAPEQGIGDEVQVLEVLPESPGAAAGLLPGDKVLSLDGWAVRTGQDGAKAYNAKIAELLKTGRPISAQILRGADQTITVSATPEPVCGYPVQMSEQNVVDASADGSKVIIARSMMHFATSDNELALVIVHEIAHNAMGHLKARMGNRLLGRREAFSQDFEAEADYVGLYIMARANLPIKDAAKFWRRLAVELPSNISGSITASHPATSYRILALEKTVTEIEQKRAAGQPLTPQLKDSAPKSN
jgi:hypothetical protein